MSSGCARAWRRGACGFVQGALDWRLGFHLGLFFLGDQHLFRGVHHGADGLGFGQRLAATRIQILGARSFFIGLGLGVGSRFLCGRFSGFLLCFCLGLRHFSGLRCFQSLLVLDRCRRCRLDLRSGIDAGGLCTGPLFTLGTALWLAWGLQIGVWPVVVANAITLTLASSILAMKLWMSRRV